MSLIKKASASCAKSVAFKKAIFFETLKLINEFFIWQIKYINNLSLCKFAA
jgi:hypothetical protein